MKRAVVLAAAPLLMLASPALALPLVDFDGLAHGEVVDSDFAAQDGLQISADGGVDLAVAFDTTGSSVADPDLLGPPWGGNVGSDEILGNVLIVQENGFADCTADDLCSTPDDTVGGSPALHLQFTSELISFSFLAVDIESGQANGAEVLFCDGDCDTGTGGGFLASVAFDDFGVTFGGDNTANRLPEVTAAGLGIQAFNRVEIHLNGSGGIDELDWTPGNPPQVPEPAASPLVLGALALGARRLRRQRPFGRISAAPR